MKKKDSVQKYDKHSFSHGYERLTSPWVMVEINEYKCSIYRKRLTIHFENTRHMCGIILRNFEIIIRLSEERINKQNISK